MSPTKVASLYASIGGDASQLTNALAQAKTSLQDTKQQMDALNNASLGLGAGFTGVATAGGALLYSSTQLAARVETLGVVTQTLGANVGYSRDQITNLEQSIKSEGITLQASRQAIAQMVEANVNLSNATQLARIAQDAAVISGENSSQTFEKLIYVISSGNTLMARRMGLMVDFQAAYEREAKAVGVSTTALTEDEKAQARVNEVMRLGQSISGAYTNAMDTAGKKVTSLDRHIEESKRMFGEVWLPVYADAVDFVTTSLESWENLDQAQKNNISRGVGLATSIAGVEGATFLLYGTLGKATTALKAFGATMSGVEGIGLAGSLWQAVGAFGPLAAGAAIVGASIYGMIQAGEATKKIFDDWTASIDNQVKSEASAVDITNQYIDKVKALEDEMNKSGLATRIFGQDQTFNTVSIDAVNKALQESTSNFSLYDSSLHRIADASGLVIDAQGNLVKVTEGEWGPVTQLVEAHFELSQALYNEYHATDQNLSAHEQWRLSVIEGTGATKAAVTAADSLAASTDKITASIGKFSKASEAQTILSYLNQQFQNGTISQDEYELGIVSVQSKLMDLTPSEIAAQMAIFHTNQNLASGQETWAQAIEDAYNYTGAINGIPEHKDVTITTTYTTVGGAPVPHKDILLTPPTTTPSNTDNTYNPGRLGSGTSSTYTPPEGYAKGTPGWLTVPPGHPNDSYNIGLTSGEQFNVRPAGQPTGGAGGAGGMGGGDTYYTPITISVFGATGQDPEMIGQAVINKIQRAMRMRAHSGFQYAGS